MADESWQKVQETNAANAELETQNKTLKNSRKKYIKEKTALLASCALLSGTLWPAVNQIEVLKRHKRILTSMTLRLSSLQEHARFLCETLSYELSGVTRTPLGSVLHCQSGRELLLKFRVGVVAILALNRLFNFTLRRRTSIVVSEGLVGGLDATLVVHCGRSTEQTVEFRGKHFLFFFICRSNSAIVFSSLVSWGNCQETPSVLFQESFEELRTARSRTVTRQPSLF